jgi:hypothetical protein
MWGNYSNFMGYSTCATHYTGNGKYYATIPLMTRYRKLLIVSSTSVVVIVGALFSYPLIDLNSEPERYRPITTVSGPEQVHVHQAGGQNAPPENVDRPVPSTLEKRLTTKGAQHSGTASDSITLSGWLGTEFGEYIAAETVILYSPTLRARYSVITSNFGEFMFPDLKPSYDYTLKVSPKRVFKRYTRFPIKLRLSQEVRNILLEPIPLGILAGRVSDPYGRPVDGIALNIKTAEIDSWAANITTDANGVFSLAGFPKGRFQLETSGRHLLTATGLIFDPDAGQPVKLTVDYGPYYIRGRIYDESGQTFDSAHVFLIWSLQENNVRFRSTRQTSVDASGKFRFIELGPGKHELVVTARRVDTYGQTIERTFRKTVNLGIDSGDLYIFISTL